MSQPWNANNRAAVDTILIVHPDPRLCELLQLALSSSGYEISISADADEGVGQFRRVNPDLTLVDLGLAVGQGNEFCEFLQGQRSGRRVPMIVISDLSPAETARQALTLNVEDFLSRPFSPPELLLRVRQSLRRLRDTRALNRAREDLDDQVRQIREELDTVRQQARARSGGIKAVADFTRRLDPTEDRTDLEQLCLSQAALLGHTRGAGLFQPPYEGADFLVATRWLGVPDQAMSSLRLPLRGELLRLVASAGTPVRLCEFDRVPATSLEAGGLAAAGLAIVAPLVLRQRLTGLLALGEPQVNSAPGQGNGSKHQADLEALGLFAGSVAHLLEANRLRLHERELAVHSLDTLVEGIEGRFPHLAGHSRRVTQLALAAGRRLNLAEDELEVLRAAAPLHDIGRLLDDPEILTRPGPLSPQEWERVRRHPVEGARLAAEAHWPERVQKAIRHQRERWSGEGYPSGLLRDAIPMASRIIGVADCLDAMQSPRPYRQPCPEQEVRRFLMAESGKSFDPVVVEAVLAVDGLEEALGRTGTSNS